MPVLPRHKILQMSRPASSTKSNPAVILSSKMAFQPQRIMNCQTYLMAVSTKGKVRILSLHLRQDGLSVFPSPSGTDNFIRVCTRPTNRLDGRVRQSIGFVDFSGPLLPRPALDGYPVFPSHGGSRAVGLERAGCCRGWKGNQSRGNKHEAIPSSDQAMPFVCQEDTAAK